MNTTPIVCVYCGSREGLNTELTITLDDAAKVTVLICDAHAEDASVKSAKAKFLERKKEVDDLFEKMRALGIDMVPAHTQSGLIVATPVQRQPTVQKLTSQPAIVEDQSGMVDTDLVDGRIRRGMVSVSGMAGSQVIESHQNHDLQELNIAPDVLKGKVRMEAVEGRGGVPIVLPTERIDKLGTTRINVIKTSDDEIQRRFKNMALQSRSDAGWQQLHDFGKEGYQVVNCPICKGGQAIIHNGKKMECPKCGGRGTL